MDANDFEAKISELESEIEDLRSRVITLEGWMNEELQRGL